MAMNMITPVEAKEKILKINPATSKEVYQLFCDVLDRKKVLTQEGSFRDLPSRQWVLWLEERLAQKHLKYLDPSQVNGIWGGSLTDALSALCKKYFVSFSKKEPMIGATVLSAILDGSKSNEEIISARPNTYEWFERIYFRLKYPFRTEPMQFNVAAIRGYLLPKGEVPNIGDKWNDTFFIVYVDSSGRKIVEPFVGSVDPGLYYYSLAPLFTEEQGGCAHIVEGIWKYQKGIHINYPAFVQAEPFTVARTNKANYNDRTKRTTGWYGINNHAGYEYGAESVYNSSAGCLVIKSQGQYGSQWLRYKSILDLDKDGVFSIAVLNTSQIK